ncbi:MAG: YopX family protein [Ruminococcus sp.]|nr:YopX family protein [Ruminococcus sp.]
MSEMREILFKAKRKDNGEWIEGLTLFKLDEHLYMFQTAWGKITYDLQHNITAILGGKKPFLVEVMPETVGRYTGLTDKNGVKIFEGDIVEYFAEYSSIYSRTEKATVHWSDSIGAFRVRNRLGTDYILSTFNEVKVTGNIHDNPELLKEVS